MTKKEKFEVLSLYERLPELSEEHFPILRMLSTDTDSFIRSQAAALLINFESEEAKEILLRLAKDPYYFVRTEAYDSIRVFEEEEIKQFLEQAIVKEKTEFARNYAILSWSDVTVELREDVSKELSFINKQKKFQKTERCRLACCYAQHMFGLKEVIKEVISFFNSENAMIRRCALVILERCLEKDNQEIIKSSLSMFIQKEKARGIRIDAEKLMERIENWDWDEEN